MLMMFMMMFEADLTVLIGVQNLLLVCCDP